MRNFVLLALLYVIHVKEADLFFLDQIGKNKDHYCSKGSSAWEDCKTCKCRQNHDTFYCPRCLGCDYMSIECEGQLNAEHDCSKGSSLWTYCHGCYCNHEYHNECINCVHCHYGQVQCEVQTQAPLPVVTDSPITTSKPHSSTCDIVAIFDAVARNQFIENLKATPCHNGQGRHDNDALVMTLCNAPESAKWIEGEQQGVQVRNTSTVVEELPPSIVDLTVANAVLLATRSEVKQNFATDKSKLTVLFRDGTCSKSAKPYTPIFYHEGNVRLAGILISCSGSEIRYFFQECDTTPVVRHVNSNGIKRIHVLTWT